MRQHKAYTENYFGFTMLEVLITITVLTLLLLVAVPSYNNFISQKHLKTCTEDLYNYIKAAQSHSMNKQQNFFLSFRPGATWCYGLDDIANCDCSAANSCTVDNIETVVRSTDYQGQVPELDITGFTGAAGTPYILFDGQRGTVNTAGSATFSFPDSGFAATVNTNRQGLTNICSDNSSSYPSCTSP